MKALLILPIIFTLISCGGDDSSGSTGSSNTGGGGGSLPPVRPAGTFNGVAHDAPLNNADVKIYDWTNGTKGDLLAETTTNNVGDYSLEITTDDKPILIEAGNSGSYKEESSGRTVSLQSGQNITAVTYYQSGETLDLQVTPFTNLARCYAEYLVGTGESVPDSLNLANSKIAALAGVDIIATKPLDVTNINNSSTELSAGLKYGFLTAAISASMVDVSTANGLDAHSQSFLTSIQWSKIACNDIKADGLLDGNGFIDDTTTGALSFGTYQITASTYRDLVAQRILSFAKSPENQTGLVIGDLLTFANALSTNTDEVWSGLAAQPVDDTGPTITALIAENSFIGGTTQLTFTVDDPIGVSVIRFYVDDALVSTQAGTDTTLNLNTLTYLDGSHVIKVESEDIIGNETTVLVNYNFINTGAAINLTSDTIVGSTSYQAEGTWVSTGTDLTSIDVNGISATINLDGTWNAVIDLVSGDNAINVIATDTLTNTTTETYTVGVDMNTPFFTLSSRNVPKTSYQGQYNLCNTESYTNSTSTPLCIRSDRVSLNGASINSIIGGTDYMYLNFEVEDSLGAGVFSDFEELTVQYKYEKNGVEVQGYQTLTTGVKYTQPSVINGYFILPITTEYLGDDWFNTSTSDTHKITVKLTDKVGNSTEQEFTMTFDVLLYNVGVTSSSNASSVMNQSFASRATINLNTVTTKAIITNDSNSSNYLTFTESNTNSIEQNYESVIRKNKSAVVTTESWKLGNTPVNTVYNGIFSYVTFDYFWTQTDVPSPQTGSYVDTNSDVGSVPNNTDWVINSDYACTENMSMPQVSNTRVGDVNTIISKQYLASNDISSEAGCGRTSVSQMSGSVVVSTTSSVNNNFFRKFSYTSVNQSGYPRNEVTDNIINHTVNDAVYSVYNVSNSSLISFTNGYYEIPANSVVEVRKTITLPNLPNYDDTEINNLNTFSSYSQKELDKEITWTLDENIDMNLYASIGASAQAHSVGSVNNFTITR